MTGTTAASTEQERVIEAYRRLWVEIVAANNPPDPDSPRLAEVATGEMLEKAREQVRTNKMNGKSLRQPSPSRFRFVARNITIAGDVAQLQGCMIDDFFLVNESDGTPVATGISTRSVIAKLQKGGGRWRIASNTFTDTKQGVEECA